MEEWVVFPAAFKALQPEDWEDIVQKLTDRHDPLSPLGVEEKFDTLRQTILKMEEEAEAERPD
jgi:hypothetical protein